MKKTIILILLTISITIGTPGAEQNKKTTGNINTYALIVSGINKHPKELQAKDKAVLDLRSFFLNNAGVKPDRISVLVDSNSLIRKNAKISTAENLKQQINVLAAAVKPEDRFIFYYVGQANIVADKLRLNLPGADITHEQLAEWINQIKASSMLIVLDCPGAGLAVKDVAGQGRIVIGACTAEQHYSTKFSEYFLPALVNNEIDTNSDDRISLLEVFTFTSKELDDFYRRQELLKTETPILEDNADGIPSRQPWRYKVDKTDGLAASMFFLLSE
ncbi:MAG: hypothetical protein ACYTFW_01695 [Planctomycetota bacterium]